MAGCLVPFVFRGLPSVEPDEGFIVAGNPSPDITGALTEAGTYESLPYYTTAQGGYFVWYSTSYSKYLITSGLGSSPNGEWVNESTGASPVGTYNPEGEMTGIVTISAS